MEENLREAVNHIQVPTDLKERYSIEGKVAVITGGASGLGEAIAIGFAQFGAKVVLLDKNEAGLQRVTQLMEETGKPCSCFPLDVTDPVAVEQVAKQVIDQYGRVDILVNSAGMNIRKPALELEPEEFQKIIQVDLIGSFYSCKYFGAYMVQQKKGSVINVASINAHVALKGNVAYGCAKGGVVQLTKILAAEWAQSGVRVNAISPAHHKTPLVTQLVSDPKWYEALVGCIPMGRFAEAYEIIGPALYLASDASSFTTGISLLTDGGWVTV